MKDYFLMPDYIFIVIHYTDPSRMYNTRNDASSAVVSRQQSIGDTYDQLMKLAKVCIEYEKMCTYMYACMYISMYLCTYVGRYVHTYTV